MPLPARGWMRLLSLSVGGFPSDPSNFLFLHIFHLHNFLFGCFLPPFASVCFQFPVFCFFYYFACLLSPILLAPLLLLPLPCFLTPYALSSTLPLCSFLHFSVSLLFLFLFSFSLCLVPLLPLFLYPFSLLPCARVAEFGAGIFTYKLGI